MRQKVLNVGIDIAAEKFDTAVMVGEDFHHKEFQNDESGFKAAFKWLKGYEAERIVIALEPTGRYGELLSEYFFKRECRVLEVQPLMFSRFAESLDLRGKSDHKDCKALAVCGKERPEKLREWKPKTELQHELRDIQVLLRSLCKRRTAIKNTLKCKLRSTYVMDSLKKELVIIDESFDEALKMAHQLIKQDEQLFIDLKLVDSIPGVGLQTAILLITLIDFRSFKNSRAVACFLGLTKRKEQSGKSVRGREGMSKRGNTFIRSELFMPARSSVQCDEVSNDLYHRLKSNGKLDVQAQVAVMRRMVTVAWSLIDKQAEYVRDHQPAYRAAIVT
jgi:transposase